MHFYTWALISCSLWLTGITHLLAQCLYFAKHPQSRWSFQALVSCPDVYLYWHPDILVLPLAQKWHFFMPNCYCGNVMQSFSRQNFHCQPQLKNLLCEKFFDNCLWLLTDHPFSIKWFQELLKSGGPPITLSMFVPAIRRCELLFTGLTHLIYILGPVIIGSMWYCIYIIVEYGIK